MSKQDYKLQNEQYFEKLRLSDDIKELRGGVLYKVIEEGTGKGEVNPRSVVTCHYKGSLINGRVFDNSYERKCPEAFRVNSLISGFQIALVNMHIGDHWLVYIPADKGYGAMKTGDIPAYSTLIFEIELISVC